MAEHIPLLSEARKTRLEDNVRYWRRRRGEGLQNAIRLATAELWADTAGWQTWWERDDVPAEDQLYRLVLSELGTSKTLDSLGGIGVESDFARRRETMRRFEAEMIAENMPDDGVAKRYVLLNSPIRSALDTGFPDLMVPKGETPGLYYAGLSEGLFRSHLDRALQRLREDDLVRDSAAMIARDPGAPEPKPDPIDAPVKLDHLDDLALLEIVLGAKAKPLLDAAGGDLVLLGQWTLPELESRGKLTGPQARRLLAALTAGKRAATRTTLDRTRVVSPAEVAKFIVGKIGTDRRREHFVELLLDVQNHVMRYIEVSEGSLSATLVHPREVFAPAITDRAHAIIVAHNHPSGAVQPSQEDVALTRRLVRAGDELGIRVLDSLVVNAQGDYFSLADAGMMRP